MPLNLPISFPPEAKQLRDQIAAQRDMNPTERLIAAMDALAAGEALSLSGTQRAHQLEYHRQCEEEWRHKMSEFIARHGASECRITE